MIMTGLDTMVRQLDEIIVMTQSQNNTSEGSRTTGCNYNESN